MPFVLSSTILSLLLVAQTFILIGLVVWQKRHANTQQTTIEHLHHQNTTLQTLMAQSQQQDQQHRQHFVEQVLQQLALNQTTHQKNLHHHMDDIRKQLQTALHQHANTLEKPLHKLTDNVEKRLMEMTAQVDKKLSGGFEKTNTIFTQVIERLSKIDAAQKRISELSTHVVDLQTLLSDKRSRGAFGEIQLENILRNALPPQHFSLQHTLSNGKRADCLLILPEPTGHTVIDAKFPLESFKAMFDDQLAKSDQALHRQQFKKDIIHHINSIADKYICPPETSDGAMMFLPAEAIFAEIHAHFPEIIAHSQKKRVWLTSPTTMMAILTTASAVLKDVATRQQIHIIQKHLSALGQDFQRFQKRMDALNKHIQMAQKDADMVHTSSKKITNRFMQIEQVNLETPHESPEQPSPNTLLPETEEL